jgi:hypothetical protein
MAYDENNAVLHGLILLSDRSIHHSAFPRIVIVCSNLKQMLHIPIESILTILTFFCFFQVKLYREMHEDKSETKQRAAVGDGCCCFHEQVMSTERHNASVSNRT